MKWPTFTEAVGALMGLGAVSAIVYASIWQGKDPAMTALIGIAGAAVGFFLRAKVLDPTAPPVVVNPVEPQPGVRPPDSHPPA